MKNELKQRG